MSIDLGAKYVWHNGEFVAWDDARVHVMTNALHYGTGVFEGIRAYYNGNQLYIFRLREHVARLLNSIKLYGFGIDYGSEELSKAIKDTLIKNGFRTDLYIRPLAIKGLGPIGLDVRKLKTEVFIIAMPYGKYFEKEGIEVIVSSWRRLSGQTVPILAKVTGHYVNSVLAKLEALNRGFDDAILLNEQGRVCEGSGENIMAVKDGIIITPPLSAGILDGITRRSLMEVAGDAGFRIVERDMERSELYTADELFFVGTAAEITPILKVDGRTVGSGNVGPVASKLKILFTDVVKGRVDKYRKWLDPVW
ncbi:MAG: branched-chain amino acid transaminase [Nitrososphaerota archaeon]|jgi:branched-chain amino acid aminotransferase|nr:branched-chain amino acid transaminase [Nitrososphaerota archaeon]MDG6930291.1 branched-chain amino acid transaminase [Nitrososphaerota archaeon]MDG6935337.1 branched-chain amino acid transaminase [Nitrososphaerota archaeon]